MGFEVACGLALLLLTALIYGTLQYRYRNRRATAVGDEITRQRYENTAL
jgi:hypothetical protein